MKYYPALLDLKDQLVVVVGGGTVAARKISVFLNVGATLIVIAPKLKEKTEKLVKKFKIKVIRKKFCDKYLDDAILVVCATNDVNVNKKVAFEAKKRKIFVNVVDFPDLCSFIVPSIVCRGDLIIAVSTSGAFPLLAKTLRLEMEKKFTEKWNLYLEFLRILRMLVKNSNLETEKVKIIFSLLIKSDLFEYFDEFNYKKILIVIKKIFEDILDIRVLELFLKGIAKKYE